MTSVPSVFGDTCEEMYMAVAPSTSGPPNNTFTPRDVFITNGVLIYRFTPPTPPNPLTAADVFAIIPDGGCAPDHTGITFDHVGTFGYDMIVTCGGGGSGPPGGIWRKDGVALRAPSHVADLTFNGQGLEAEGPAVVPSTFGPNGGDIWVANENYPGFAPPVLSTQSRTLLHQVPALTWFF